VLWLEPPEPDPPLEPPELESPEVPLLVPELSVEAVGLLTPAQAMQMSSAPQTRIAEKMFFFIW